MAQDASRTWDQIEVRHFGLAGDGPRPIKSGLAYPSTSDVPFKPYHLWRKLRAGLVGHDDERYGVVGDTISRVSWHEAASALLEAAEAGRQ